MGFFLEHRKGPEGPRNRFITQNMWQVQIAESPLHQLALRNRLFEDKGFQIAKNTLELKMEINQVLGSLCHQTPASSRRSRRGARAERSKASFRR
jgi:hypothetical protein